MAEFAVIATAHNGYEQFDLLDALPDGAEWGTLDLADVASGKMYIIKVPSIDIVTARSVLRALMEPAQAGDPELDAPDEADHFVRRARRNVRVFIDELPPPKRNDLNSVGITTLSLGQARSVYRKMTWNRTTGRAEDTGQGALS
jgi:hypothetical protein